MENLKCKLSFLIRIEKLLKLVLTWNRKFCLSKRSLAIWSLGQCVWRKTRPTAYRCIQSIYCRRCASLRQNKICEFHRPTLCSPDWCRINIKSNYCKHSLPNNSHSLLIQRSNHIHGMAAPRGNSHLKAPNLRDSLLHGRRSPTIPMGNHLYLYFISLKEIGPLFTHIRRKSEHCVHIDYGIFENGFRLGTEEWFLRQIICNAIKSGICQNYFLVAPEA